MTTPSCRQRKSAAQNAPVGAVHRAQLSHDCPDLFAALLQYERHLDPYDSATDRLWYTLVEASLVMSLCAGFGVVGKLSFGWLSDRLSVRKVMGIVIFMQFSGQYLMFTSLTT